MKMDMPSNMNDPIAFFAHAKKNNNAGSKKQCQGSVLIEGIHLMMMTTTQQQFQGKKQSKEWQIQENPGIMNLMLLITSKNNFILYLPSLLPLLRIAWEIG